MKKKHILKTVAVSLSAIAATAGLYAGSGALPVMAEEAALPAAFDLRNVDTDGDGIGDRCFVTSVKNQQPFNDCWGFAAVAASEISILGSVLADDPEAYKTFDLSEKQLAFFANKALDDPASDHNGEGNYPVNPDVPGAYYDTGGTPIMATNLFAQGIGLTKESTDPLLQYKGVEGNRHTIAIPGTDQVIDMGCYSPDDNWTLDEKFRFMQDFVMTESHLLPSPAVIKDPQTGEEIPYQYNPEGTKAIKSELMQKRGVVIGYHTDDFMPVYFNEKTKAHYTYEQEPAGHAVTIVGWDDNYPASNFAEGHEPPGDGAWLIKNSWGAGTEEFPNKATGDYGIPVELKDADGNVVTDEQGNPVMVGSGYMWLSYYDKSIIDPESFVFEPAADAELSGYGIDKIQHDQYDFMPVADMLSINATETFKQANIFKAEDGGKLLAAVAFNINEQGSTQNEVKYSVYILGDDYKDPDDGVLMAEGIVSPKYGGYYAEAIEPVFIEKGQSYSIVLEQTNAAGEHVMNFCMSQGENAESVKAGEVPIYSKAVVNPGESFLYGQGEWLDWTSDEVREGLGVSSPESSSIDPQIDNFPIKGLYVDMDSIYGEIGFADGLKRLELKENGDTKKVGLQMLDTGLPVEPGLYKIEWSVVGDESVVDITPSTDNTSVEVKGLKEGTVWLSAKIEGIKAVLLPVNVTPAETPTEPTDPTESTDNTDPTQSKETETKADPDNSKDKDSTAVTPDKKSAAPSGNSVVKVTPAGSTSSPATGDKASTVWIVTAAAAAGSAVTAIAVRRRKGKV